MKIIHISHKNNYKDWINSVLFSIGYVPSFLKENCLRTKNICTYKWNSVVSLNTPKIKYLIKIFINEFQIMTHAVSFLYPKINQRHAQNAMELELFSEFNVQRWDEILPVTVINGCCCYQVFTLRWYGTLVVFIKINKQIKCNYINSFFPKTVT